MVLIETSALARRRMSSMHNKAPPFLFVKVPIARFFSPALHKQATQSKTLVLLLSYYNFWLTLMYRGRADSAVLHISGAAEASDVTFDP